MQGWGLGQECKGGV